MVEVQRLKELSEAGWLQLRNPNKRIARFMIDPEYVIEMQEGLKSALAMIGERDKKIAELVGALEKAIDLANTPDDNFQTEHANRILALKQVLNKAKGAQS